MSLLVALGRVRNIAALSCRLSSSVTSERTPWFLSPNEPHHPSPNTPVQGTSQLLPLPEGTPDHLRKLFSELSMSPYLEASSLMVTRPIVHLPASPLPFMRRKGSRRKRGGTDSGFGIDMPDNGLWSWFLLAQVKEGTERRGSLNTMVKVVRQTLRQLASDDPSLALPPKRKQSPTDGWVMLDVGDFAVHILSRDAKEKWFSVMHERL